jgi:hypothetical protein
MSKPKPQPVQAPFQQNNVNTYGTMSIADTPEAKAFLDVPLDIDPGVGRRGDLAEQEMSNRWNSAFAQGVPEHIRMQQQDAERRNIRSQSAAEAQQAEYAKNLMELERRKTLLPQIVQTGGNSSGFNTQIVQPQPSPLWGMVGQLGSAAITKI